MNKYLWKAILNDERAPVFPARAYIRIRLWVEGDKPEATDFWILIGEFDPGEPGLIGIQDADLEKLDFYIRKTFALYHADIESYGRKTVQKVMPGSKGKRVSVDQVRTVHVDMHIPKELIDGYAG